MRRLTIIAVTVALITFASLLLLSWLGGGATNPPQSHRVIRLGPRHDFWAAERLALARLAEALQRDSSVQFVEVRWTDSYFFGFAAAHQLTIDYDRRTSELGEYYMEDGPRERWRPVPESLIQALAPRGFDRQMLHSSGSHTDLP